MNTQQEVANTSGHTDTTSTSTTPSNNDALPTYAEATSGPKGASPPSYKRVIAQRESDTTYAVLNTVIDQTQFGDVEGYDYEELNASIAGVTLEAGEEWSS